MRNLCTNMGNKLVLLSLALTFVLVSSAQDGRFHQSSEISVYPNPAVSYLIIELDNTTFKSAKFEINSMIGNNIIIHPEELGFGKFRISVKDFSTGYYFLIIQDESSRIKHAYKFLKN